MGTLMQKHRRESLKDKERRMSDKRHAWIRKKKKKENMFDW